ncbi:MAG: ATP-binding protein, partial [Actinomycetota bacterium]|nr:ATP-binding protein [Actinomycetota bacterium]
MEPLDAGFQALQRIRDELPDYADTVVTEADTRLKVIDRILREVLGWPLGEIHAEEAAGPGFVDYKLTVNDLARLVVEAKRDGRDLGLAGEAGRSYKLGGPMFRAEAVREGIEQAIIYCAHHSAELAAVTNGHEWMVFRANRLGDGRRVKDGYAFVFPSLHAVADHFKLFWHLLSYDGVLKNDFRPYFLEAEGSPIRTVAFLKPLRDPASSRLLKSSDLGADVRAIMSRFFTRLSGDMDPELLAACFVETRESSEADRALARISEDLLAHIRRMDDATGRELTELIEVSLVSDVRDFVILVGTKGAGKSTFIDRFFRFVLPEDITCRVMAVTVDLREHPGDPQSVVDWLKKRLLQNFEEKLYRTGVATYDELRGMFYDEYVRLREGTLRHLYDHDQEAFRIEFGRMLEAKRASDSESYIRGLMRHVVTNRKLLPVLIFDNADHFTIEFQEAVYQYARSLHAHAACLTILPITDHTSWQLSRHGALQSFEHEALYLPTPPMRSVLQKRIGYLAAKVSEEHTEGGRYFTERGIRLSLRDLGGFVASLERVFIDSPLVAEWIARLSNNDVRRALQLSAEVVSSPHLQVSDLVKAHVAGTTKAIPLHRIKSALIRGRYDVYPVGRNQFVHNIFAMTDDADTSPLMGLRLLRLLHDAPREEHVGSFLSVSDVITYMTTMQLSQTAVQVWLDALLQAGLCLEYDPTIDSVYKA